MVNAQEYPDKISGLKVICKDCTNRLDQRGIGHKLWHNIWELSWVKDDYFGLMERAIENLDSENPAWTPNAIKDLHNLGKMLYLK